MVILTWESYQVGLLENMKLEISITGPFQRINGHKVLVLCFDA